MNTCVVYRFWKLCNNVALYNKLKDSPLVDLGYCYGTKSIVPYASIKFHLGSK